LIFVIFEKYFSESKFSQFKGMLATKNDTLDDDLEDLGADI